MFCLLVHWIIQKLWMSKSIMKLDLLCQQSRSIRFFSILPSVEQIVHGRHVPRATDRTHIFFFLKGTENSSYRFSSDLNSSQGNNWKIQSSGHWNDLELRNIFHRKNTIQLTYGKSPFYREGACNNILFFNLIQIWTLPNITSKEIQHLQKTAKYFSAGLEAHLILLQRELQSILRIRGGGYIRI